MQVASARVGPFVELFTKDKQLTAGLNRAAQQLKTFGSMAAGLGRQLAGIGIAAATPLALMTNRFAQFDDKMREVRAVGQLSEAQFAQLSQRAKELGASTSFSAVQVAGLMSELARAGFSADDISTMTEAVLNLARASGTDATISAGIMSSAIRQFGMNGTQAARVADALTMAANASFSTVEGLGESLQYAGPVAASFNMTIEDTLAVLGALGNVGIQGSEAGTTLRRLLILTGAEAQKVGEIFGVAAQDAAGNALPLVDILERITHSVQGLGTSARAAKFNELFGLLGITGATALGNNIANVRELRQQLAGAGGTAARTAQQMDAGLGGTMRRSMAAVEGLAISLGEALAPALRFIGDGLISGVRAMRDWIGANQNTVVIIGLSVIGIVGLGAALLGLALAFKLAAVGLAVFTVPLLILKGIMVIVGGLFSTTALLIAGLFTPIGFLMGAFDAYRTWAAVASGATARLGEGLSQLADIGGTTFKGIMDAIREGDWQGAMEMAGAGLIAAWETIIASLRGAWRNFRDFFLDNLSDLGNALGASTFGRWIGRQFDRQLDAAGIGGTAASQAAINRQVAGMSPEYVERGIREGWLSPSMGTASAISSNFTSSRATSAAERAAARAAADAADREEAEGRQMDLATRANDVALARNERRRMEELNRMWAEAEQGRGPAGQVAAGAQGAFNAAAQKTDIAGTFSAFAVRALGADSTAKTIADNTRDAADSLRTIANRGGGLGIV